MDVSLDMTLAEGYRSASQIARVLSEAWTAQQMYCPLCGHPRLTPFPHNREVADFFCPSCKEQFEQKAKQGTLGHSIPDGEYDTFVERIQSRDNPDFFVMQYSLEARRVVNFFLIPKFFFTPSIAEKRKKLSEKARRAGWVGCNILIGDIPLQGRIPIVQEGVPVEKARVLRGVQEAQKVQVERLDSRGWLLDVLHCVNRLPEAEFTAKDIYAFEAELAQRHPENSHITDKIRQQLQVLRDRNVITFVKRGLYRKVQAL